MRCRAADRRLRGDGGLGHRSGGVRTTHTAALDNHREGKTVNATVPDQRANCELNSAFVVRAHRTSPRKWTSTRSDLALPLD